jgi:hypothetical protein
MATDSDDGVGLPVKAQEALRPRAPDLFDLLDILVAMRLDVCTAGDPACPVRTLAPEKIENVCSLVSRAIASTHDLIDALDVEAPGESQHRAFDPQARS